MSKIKLVDTLAPMTRQQFAIEVDEKILSVCTDAGDDVLNALRYHLSSGGSRQRAKLAYTTARSFGHSHEHSIAMAASVEMLHNASIIHDDIQDNDLRRRGKAALWVKYGKAQAICIGDALVVAASAVLIECHHLADLLKLINRRTQQTICGQLKDVDSEQPMTVERYRQVAREKSAPLLCLATELAAVGQLYHRTAACLSDSAVCFATAYQFSDDVADADDDRRAEEPNIVNLTADEIRQQQPAMDVETSTKKALQRVEAEITSLLVEAESNLASLDVDIAEPLLALVKNLHNKTKR